MPHKKRKSKKRRGQQNVAAAEPQLSVEESSSSGVRPFSGEIKVLNLPVVYGDQPVAYYGDSSRLWAGQMSDGSDVVLKIRPQSEITAARSEKDTLSKLDHPAVIRFITCHEDKTSSYLVLEYVKSTLEERVEQISTKEPDECKRKTRLTKLMVEVLQGLLYLQQKELHVDITHRNILVDKHGKPKWMDIKSTEANCESRESEENNEIIKAGKLAYYILSGGRSYYEVNCSENLSELEWDFIQWMTEAKKSLRTAIDHPVFWNKYRKLSYLESLGNLPAVIRLSRTKGHKTYMNWRNVIKHKHKHKLDEMEKKRIYSKEAPGLLRFIRNYKQHHVDVEGEEEIDFLTLFDGLFDDVYILARNRDWNSECAVMKIFSDWK